MEHPDRGKQRREEHANTELTKDGEAVRSPQTNSPKVFLSGCFEEAEKQAPALPPCCCGTPQGKRGDGRGVFGGTGRGSLSLRQVSAKAGSTIPTGSDWRASRGCLRAGLEAGLRRKKP